MNDAEGHDSETTTPSHLQGGILVNFKTRKVASLVNLKRRIYERNGMIQVAQGRVGIGALKCDCTEPCGFRYFPGVALLRDLHHSDVEKLLRRVYSEAWIQKFAEDLRDLQKQNERFRTSGILRRCDMMFLGRVPGVLVRGLCHDFPDEFSTVTGGTIAVQHQNLERVLSEFFVNRCFRPAGATA